MRRCSSVLVTCIIVLLGGVACWGGPPALPLTSTANATSTVASAGRPPTAPAAAIPSPAIMATATRSSPRATVTPRPATPRPGTPAPTPTEPRLDLNPPGTPPRPSTTPTPIPTPTLSGREATISQIWGTASPSPLHGQIVRVKGIVTANFQETTMRGFYMQEVDVPHTTASTGILVSQDTHPTPDIKIGDDVTVVGFVIESAGRAVLDISRAGAGLIVTSSGNALPPPIELRPLAANADARSYLAQYVGMLVSVPRAIVVAPTDRDGSFTIIRADDSAVRLPSGGTRGADWRLTIGAVSGARYDVAAGEVIDGIIGPLDRQGDHFVIQQLAEQKLVITPAPPATPGATSTRNGRQPARPFALAALFTPTQRERSVRAHEDRSNQRSDENHMRYATLCYLLERSRPPHVALAQTTTASTAWGEA